MPLRINLSDLTRMQRQWAALMPGADHDTGRLTEVESFGSNPGELRMLSFVPPDLPPGAPLVVALHGCSQNAAGYDSGAGWSGLAERHNFAVLLPEQRRSNNAHNCFNWFDPADTTRGEGEVASVRQMIAQIVAAHKLNPRRVYISGLSAGGAMTAAMLATYPEVFAAGAIIAGLPYGAASGVSGALSAMQHGRALSAEAWGDLVRAASPVRDAASRPAVSIWHGDADQTVAPGNALASAKQWINVHGLHEAAGVEDSVAGVPHRAWRGRDGAVRVELFAVPGLGHGTPITPHAEGDQGAGRAMPFMLDAAISSTWQLAQSWGLLAPAATARPRPVIPASAERLFADPRGVIARSLRAVGLLGPH